VSRREHERLRVVPAEDRVFAAAPGRQRIQPATSLAQPGTKIAELVRRSPGYLIRCDRFHRLTECVSIGETAHGDPATGPEPDLPPSSGVDLDPRGTSAAAGGKRCWSSEGKPETARAQESLQGKSTARSSSSERKDASMPSWS
jgi:hypothetical protein